MEISFEDFPQDSSQRRRLEMSELKNIVLRHQAYKSMRPNGARASFKCANLAHKDFSGLDLSEADFTGADLTGADIRAAQLKGARLTGVKGLERKTR